MADSKKKIACIFNYAPLYRESIYKKIDEEFDCQFYFGEEIDTNKESKIPKIDYCKFKRNPIIIKNKVVLRKYLWRSGILTLPFKNYKSFIITGDLSLSYIPFLMLCKIFGKKVFAWGHGFKSIRGLAGCFIKLYLRLLTGFYLYGDLGKERMLELGFPKKKLIPIYNSLHDRSWKTPGKASDLLKKHFENSYPNIIFIGRLTREKRLIDLLNIQKKHQSDGVFYNITIIGDGAELVPLMEYSKNAKIESNVWFYGATYNDEEQIPLIFNADLCVSPGNIGLTAITSLQNGTPIITHNNYDEQGPEFETIKSGINGDLYQYDNIEDLSSKIKLWICTDKDREKIRNDCIESIDEKWNSDYQLEVIRKTLE